MNCVVKKRNGQSQHISSKKIKDYLSVLCNKHPKLTRIHTEQLMKTMSAGFASHMDARDIPNYVSDVASSLVLDHYEYGYLAGRAIVSKLHKETPERFSYFVKDSPFLSDEMKRRVSKHADAIDNMIQHNRDYNFDIFGIKTLQRSYLLKENNRFVERPQYMYMRVAVMVGETLPRIQETYEALSQHRYTHATPTLFHAGFKKQQLASCFLMTIGKDSIDSIFNTIKKAANISKGAGGIGLAISNIRAKGSLIKGTGGTSNGIVPMIKVINETMRYVDQCVLPSTYVYTLQGPKQIQYLSNGDKIIHESSVEEIQNVLEHPIEKASMRVIHTMHSIEPITITEEHPVFALKDIGKAYNFNEIKKRLDNHTIAPDWIDVKDLQTRDFIAYPIPQYQKDITNISEDDCYFYGVLLGDGHVNQTSMYGHITFHTIDKKHIGDFLKGYFDSKCIQYDETVEGNTSRIRWNKTTILPIKYGDIYDMNKEKHVSPKWLHLPREKISKIVQGLMDTDGCVAKEIVFDSTSRNLIESMRYMCLRLGMLTSGYIRNRVGQCHQTAKGPITNRKISYTLRIPKTETISTILGTETGCFFKFFQHNNMLFTRVKKMEETEYTGTLYDLQFQKDHSYITHNGLIHNGGGKRKGSCALYLEPHHPDIVDFLQMKKPNGLEEHRARDLFYAVYLSDLFMERVKDDQMWSLIDPNECPALQDAVGEQYRSLYQQLEKENRIVKSIRARQLWFDILDAQTETGTPYILYKDACNLKSNQQNLGTIRCSNLCCEILEYTSEKEVAVCTLASIALNKFVTNNQYDFEALAETTKLVVRNLDRCIDCTYYPIKEAKTSNKKHRPMGIGVQALADVFALLKMPYESQQAATLNKQIFETMYYAALTESHRLATVKGAYDTFEGSPLSKGQFQFDLWGKQPLGMYDWETLRSKIQRDGVRHSLLLALMPTASTAQIMGNTESFEPRTSNLYTRRVLSGEYVVVNKQLQDYLYDKGLWMSSKDQIIRDRGSIKNINVSKEVKDVFKTVWEISQKSLINMAADRGIYIDQTQSFNLYVAKPSRALLSTIHMYTWKMGLKTGCYYLRSRPAADAIQFTVAVEEDNDVCMSCSS